MLTNRDQSLGEVLTLAEAAAFLKVCEKTLHKLAKGGSLPGKQVGSQWRFSRRSVLTYVEGNAAPMTSADQGGAK